MDERTRSTSFTIVTHVYATGPAFFLEEYLLKKRVKKLLFIGLPFSYAKDPAPFYRYYENGNLIVQKKYRTFPLPEVFLYMRDVFLTMFIVLQKGSFDIFVGADNLNVFAGLLLKRLLKVKNVVFYTIDYVPQRFPNKTLNSLYHSLEKLAVYKSTAVWNLSPVMTEERNKNGYEKKFNKKQLTVSIGTMPVKKIMKLTTKEKIVVYMGHLRKGQGVDFLLDAFADVVKKNSYAKLLIIGGGALEESLKRKVKKLGITKKVQFTGFVKDFSKVQSLLAKAAVAAAPYEDTKESFTRYTDPGKVKDYLAIGLPVIITKVPQVAYEIEKRKAGIAINYDKKELVDAISKLLLDNKALNMYRKNAYDMAKDYTWEKIFTKALKNTYRLC